MVRLRWFGLIALCSLAFSGCDAGRRGDPVVKFSQDNEAMQAAIETAQRTFPQFLARWQTLPSDAVSVKVGLPTTDGEVEHIWFEPIAITETEVTGVCGNQPNKIADLKLGDKRTFRRSEVSDWMILVGSTCYGGYTVRVMSKLDPANAPPFTFAEFEDGP